MPGDYSTVQYGVGFDVGGESVEDTINLHVGGSNTTKNFFFNQAAWDKILKSIVREHLEPRAVAIAKACNEHLAAETGMAHSDDSEHAPELTDGYRAGTEGLEAKQLRKRTYRATVITATDEAIVDNSRHNTLVQNFHLAEHD